MKCYCCGTEMGEADRCPNCGWKVPAGYRESQGMVDSGEKMKAVGKSLSDLGCAMTLGCTVPIIIVLILVIIFVF